MTEPALVLAPLASAVVLLLSGVAKYGDSDGTRASFTAMRVPQALTAAPVVRALPLVEIALGALLLVTWGWALALVAAAVTSLFAAYWILVLLVLRRGEEVDCGCFGAVGEDRVTASTLVRNSLLVVLAATATAFGAAGSGVLPVLRDLDRGDGLWLLLTAGVAAVAVLVVRVSSRDDPADQDADGELLDYERTEVPFAVLRDPDGNIKTLRQLASTRPQLLVFLSSACSSCHELAAQMHEWGARLGSVRIQAVYTDRLEIVPEPARAVGVPLWHDIEMGATHSLAAGGRPAAVLLGADGLLAGGPVNGKAAVLRFVDDIAAELEAAELEAAELEPAAAPADAEV